jgi:hypothetical protein
MIPLGTKGARVSGVPSPAEDAGKRDAPWSADTQRTMSPTISKRGLWSKILGSLEEPTERHSPTVDEKGTETTNTSIACGRSRFTCSTNASEQQEARCEDTAAAGRAAHAPYFMRRFPSTSPLWSPSMASFTTKSAKMMSGSVAVFGHGETLKCASLPAPRFPMKTDSDSRDAEPAMSIKAMRT